jgi:hypothetical protein
VGSQKQRRADEIRRYVESRGAAAITETDFDELRLRLAPVSPDALRKLLRESGYPLAPVVEGVRQNGFDELQRTLEALTVEYEQAAADRQRRVKLRRLVITAKDHARFAARRAKDESRRRMKEEMTEWMIVWLENPAIFPQWARLRLGRVTPPE